MLVPAKEGTPPQSGGHGAGATEPGPRSRGHGVGVTESGPWSWGSRSWATELGCWDPSEKLTPTRQASAAEPNQHTTPRFQEILKIKENLFNFLFHVARITISGKRQSLLLIPLHTHDQLPQVNLLNNRYFPIVLLCFIHHIFYSYIY